MKIESKITIEDMYYCNNNNFYNDLKTLARETKDQREISELLLLNDEILNINLAKNKNINSYVSCLLLNKKNENININLALNENISFYVMRELYDLKNKNIDFSLEKNINILEELLYLINKRYESEREKEKENKINKLTTISWKEIKFASGYNELYKFYKLVITKLYEQSLLKEIFSITNLFQIYDNKVEFVIYDLVSNQYMYSLRFYSSFEEYKDKGLEFKKILSLLVDFKEVNSKNANSVIQKENIKNLFDHYQNKNLYGKNKFNHLNMKMQTLLLKKNINNIFEHYQNKNLYSKTKFDYLNILENKTIKSYKEENFELGNIKNKELVSVVFELTGGNITLKDLLTKSYNELNNEFQGCFYSIAICLDMLSETNLEGTEWGIKTRKLKNALICLVSEEELKDLTIKKLFELIK